MLELIRNKPDLFLKGKDRGRSALACLVDDLLRYSIITKNAYKVTVEVTTEGNLRVKRDNVPSFESRFSKESRSLAEGLLQASLLPNNKCVSKSLVPIVTCIALSNKASLTWGDLKQSYINGKSPSPPVGSPKTDGILELNLTLDKSIFDASFDAFPFKSRVQEIATLTGNTDLSIDYRYMGFPPLVIEPKKGLEDLLNFISPETIGKPLFKWTSKDLTVSAVFRYHKKCESEKIKTFEDSKEVFCSPFETAARNTMQECGFQTRRHNLRPLSASKLSYFGTYTSSSPFVVKETSDMRVDTVPGLTGVITLHGKFNEEQVDNFDKEFRTWVYSTLL